MPTLEGARLLIESQELRRSRRHRAAGERSNLFPDDVEGRFLLGYAKVESADFAGAIEIYRNLLVMYPEAPASGSNWPGWNS